MARHQEWPWRILDRHGLTLTNPMDWRAIDRHILLAVLVMLAPLCLGGYLLGTLLIAPEFLHVDVAIALLAFYALFSVVFGSLITKSTSGTALNTSSSTALSWSCCLPVI